MTESFWSDVKTLWCKFLHGPPMWPIHGYYRCSTCLRMYPVPWGSGTVDAADDRLSSAPMDVPEVSTLILKPAAYGRRNPL